MSRSFVACAVAAPFGSDVDACLEAAEAVIRRAQRRGADLIVLPESALGGYVVEQPPPAPAPLLPPTVEVDGPEIARLVRAAGSTVVCLGLTEPGPYATAVCLSGDGVLGTQRKVHLPPSERFAFQPGEGFAAFDTPLGKLGMMLCYDKLFPEAARTLADDGAEIVCCLSAWSKDRHRPARRVAADRQTRHFDALDIARAAENQVTWVSSNQTGRHGSLRFVGHAKVVDPDGNVLAATSHRAGLAVATVPARASELSRIAIDHLADRRPTAYGGADVLGAEFG